MNLFSSVEKFVRFVILISQQILGEYIKSFCQSNKAVGVGTNAAVQPFFKRGELFEKTTAF